MPVAWLCLRYTDDTHNVSMPPFSPAPLGSPLDPATRSLVRLAAAAAGGGVGDVRRALADALSASPSIWIEELILQTYLFAGFPRALNAAREWRRLSGIAAPAPSTDASGGDAADVAKWRARGEATCAVVYGDAYKRLRHNITTLHPALDTWMIVEGYGKVLSRPGLDLARRELCIVAACAHTAQERQLHSHLHGAVHAGAPPESVDATFDVLHDVVSPDAMRSARLLWTRVRAQHS
jgi:4-carboxymuconolactone decarboxylase